MISFRRIRFLLTIIIGLTFVVPHAILAADGTAQTRAKAGVARLQRFYNDKTGIYDTTGWWNSANALHALIDYMRLTGDKDPTYIAAIENTYKVNMSGNFMNEFYDDEGWWALTWINANALTGEPKYLRMAETIFADMLTGWDDTCGGGTWWKKDRAYKNAIANQLFLQVAARLYNATQKTTYREWAIRSWEWIAASGMINDLDLFNDGLRDCENNGDITWTYNQGVILGGLVELHKITGGDVLLTQAQAIADSASRLLIDEKSGILREPCELSYNCGADGPQFKGIFMRNLYYLAEATNNPAYCAFIQKNADALWSNRGKEDTIGLRWYGRFDRADASRHSSGQEALNAAVGCSSLS